ncbi:Filamentous hemagglutinin [Posidoniimonas corsicana]|uniref:Filamentous hemagglutinin n=1 Tax=Posidoniimonas corsicana TaxID=1938618 RepID=A0A5C5UZV5_9BACT|nr:multiheme c-type cytochrome [Posidoniimonas corsicana]TWT31035.1 Filamentous hemagglutinin [Posidoniimonas corsicana]
MAPPRRNSSPPVLVGLIVAAAVLVGVRAVQLATRDLAQPAAQDSVAVTPPPPTSNDVRPAAELAAQLAAPAAAEDPQVRRLPPDPELRAMIGAACPHALELFDREGLTEPPPTRPTPAPPKPQPTPAPIRVAMRPTPAPGPPLRVAQRTGEWLVDPDSWFVPEDTSSDREPAPAAPAREPAEEPPAAPAPPEQSTEPTAPAPVRPLPIPAPAPAVEPDPVDAGPSFDGPDPIDVPAEPAAAPEVMSPAPIIKHAEPAHEDRVEEPNDAPNLTAPELRQPQAPAANSADEQQPWTPNVVEGPSLGLESEPGSPSDAAPVVVPLPADNPAPSTPATPTAPLFSAPGVAPTPEEPEPRYEQPPTPPAQPEVERAAEPPHVNAGPESIAAPTPVETRRPITPEPIFGAPAAQPNRSMPAADAHTHGAPHSVPSQQGKPSTDSQLSSIEAHRDLFAKNCYPSAQQCGECHKKLYDEWRVSSHAYAFVSPMFQKFEQKITNLSQGTVGYFCYRCHSPVATSLGENRATPLWEMPEVAREGVTCIACHRINERYTKANGERRIVPGDIYSPIYGGIGGGGVAEALSRPEHFKVKTSPDQKGAGQPIHLEGRYFDQLSKAEFCTSCHQVAVHPGIKLEVVWEQYRQSPACKKGVTCQDCHMGLKPGEASGYEICSIAEVGGKSVNKQRKHANHMFYGPNYSISHPGVFPHNKDAKRWSMQEWLRFNWRAGWGTDEFEEALDDGKLVAQFPQEWQEADDRYDAREVIDDNLEALEKKNEKRRAIMSDHMHVAGPFFQHKPRRGAPVRLFYDVTNLNEGHNVLTASLGAQPQLWANVVLIGPNGCRLWESGYTDSDGDLCDIHSRDVQLGRAPFDHQLFNLQTMFLITGATGTDREMPLPVNVDIDQLPFLRPGAIPITTTNHPPFIRMESRSIAPLGTKRVHYKIPKELIQAPGKYRLSFRLRNRIEPIWFMRFCDATDEMVRMMNEGILNMHERSVEFWVE